MVSTDKRLRTHEELLPQGVLYKEKIDLANLGEVEIEINDNNLSELDKYGVYLRLIAEVLCLA